MPIQNVRGKFEKAISERQSPSSSRKLKDMCRTRWLQRIDAADIFMRLYLSIVDCLENIGNEGSWLWSQDSLTDARELLLAIPTTNFVSSLVITTSCLKYLSALTASLEAETKDIVAAVSEIDNVIAALQEVRENIDTCHAQWFSTITEMLSEVGMEPSVPRRCGRQTQWSNVPADTPSEYFRRTISIPVLDHLLSELKSRFGSHQRTALLGLSIVPSLSLSPLNLRTICQGSKVSLIYMKVIFHLQNAWRVSFTAGR